MGWRWIPGTILTYRAFLERTEDARIERHVQRWDYLVRSVDDADVATLDGYKSGAGGAEILSDGRTNLPTERDWARWQTPERVTFRLGSDGRIHPMRTDRCDALGSARVGCFESQLLHRSLSPILPNARVAELASWRDAQLVEPFDNLFPPDASRTRDGQTRVVELEASPPRAYLDSRGAIRLASGVSLEVEAQTTWDLVAGRVHRRVVQAALTPAAGALLRPGTLKLTLEAAR
jgi:hypothetical protein